MTTIAAFPSINLLPASRRVALARRRRVRAWTVILAVCAVGLGGVWAWWTLGSISAARATGESTADQLSAVNKDIEQHREQQAAMSAQIAAARRTLDGAKAVGHHPAWSVLLDRLAEGGAAPNPPVVFELVDLHPRPAPAGAADPKTKGAAPAANDAPDALGYALVLEGLATSQLDVFSYAKSLQGLQLFESVSIDWTRPRDSVAPDAAGLHLVSFQISCTLTDAAAAAHAPPVPDRKPTRSTPKPALSPQAKEKP